MSLRHRHRVEPAWSPPRDSRRLWRFAATCPVAGTPPRTPCDSRWFRGISTIGRKPPRPRPFAPCLRGWVAATALGFALLGGGHLFAQPELPLAELPATATLRLLATLALTHHPDPRIAAARLAAADARWRQASGAFAPRVGVQIQRLERAFALSSLGMGDLLQAAPAPAAIPSLPGVPAPSVQTPERPGQQHAETVTEAVNVTVPVCTFGRATHARGLAAADRTRVAAERRQSEAAVIAGAIEAGLGVIRTRDLLQSALAHRAAIARHRDAVTRREAAGVAVRTHRLRAEVQLAAADEAVLLARSAVGDAEDALAASLGHDPGIPIGAVEFSPLPLPDHPLAAWQSSLATASPELAAADAGVDASRERERLERARRRPMLGVNCSWSLTDQRFPARERNWSVAGSLDWEIFDGGVRPAAVSEAAAGHREARERRIQVQRGLRTALQRAWRALDTAASRISVTRREIELADEELRLSRIQYDAGLMTLNDLLDAQTRATQARIAGIVATCDRELAALALLRVAGALDRDWLDGWRP